MHADGPGDLTRRALLGAGGAAALGTVLGGREPRQDAVETGTRATARVPPEGRHQAGVARPVRVQPHLLLAVFDLDESPGPVLADLGRAIVDLVDDDHSALAGIPVGDLTVTVGVGPRLVAAARPSAPGGADLPPFPREAIDDRHRGGDVVLQVCASDPLLLPLTVAHLMRVAPGLRERWRQRGIRGPAVPVRRGHTAARNVLGFIDGIAVPTSKTDLADSVWIDEGPVAGGTIMVVRRMVIDIPAFQALSVGEQEAAIGRRRSSGAPLSGGRIADDVDLQAKTSDGRYRLPADAHARRAHPRPIGAPLMLRRSYSMEDPMGLLFVSMQTELRTFVRTLERMSESDALLAFTTTTASGTFLVLPGFDRSRPLGSTLFGAS
ncbi:MULTISPECIES: Dyp-type peroxidase [unclassified Microbacterium]|uniref:Dyp-type peroxidase n=1 Tax=unclassified Microbacterium TaxID=2609290 RepID=UPI003414BDC1